MLMYPNYLWTWLHFGHHLLLSSFWRNFDLVKQIEFAVSGHFLENPWEEWAEIWYADVCWPPSELIRFWSSSVDIPQFCHGCFMVLCQSHWSLAAKGSIHPYISIHIHPYPFWIKVLSVSHSIGLAAPGFVANLLSMHLWDEWIHMKFSARVGYETRNNLEYFRMLRLSPRIKGWFLAATKQFYEWYFPSVRSSVCLLHLFHYVLIVSSWNFQEWLLVTKVTSMQKVKVRGQRSRSQRSQPNFPDCNSSLNPHMMMKLCI